MTRQEALTFLNSQLALAAYATDCGVGTLDNPAGWESVINAAFRATDTDIAGPVLTTLDGDTRLLLRYYALEQFADLYAMRVDLNLSTVGYAKQKSQAYKAIAERLKDARSQVEALGYIPSSESVTTGFFRGDFLEPYPVEF